LPDGSREIYLYYTRNVRDVELTKDGHIATVTLSGDVSTGTIKKSFECGATVTINAEPDT
jgi:hypothetical protein